MAARLSTCDGCGAGIARGFDKNTNEQVSLEPIGHAAMLSRDGEVIWSDIFKQHKCQPAAARSREAWIKSVTTEEERKRQQDLAEQREIAKQLSGNFACPKEKCAAPINERCVNLTILNRTGERQPTAWPHPERMELALKALQATGVGAETPDEEYGSPIE